jgi:hypothetical protein
VRAGRETAKKAEVGARPIWILFAALATHLRRKHSQTPPETLRTPADPAGALQTPSRRPQDMPPQKERVIVVYPDPDRKPVRTGNAVEGTECHDQRLHRP